MRRLIGIGATALSGLGLLGLLPTTPVAHAVRGNDEPKRDVLILKKAEAPDDQAPDALLRRAYDRIRRLKTERLEERQKGMVDQASALYRKALQALKDEKPAEARALAMAAAELATAVERVRATRETERPDPDLPPPPPPPPIRALIPPAPPVPPLPPLPPMIDGEGKVEAKKTVIQRKGVRLETKSGEPPKLFEFKLGEGDVQGKAILKRVTPGKAPDIEVRVEEGEGKALPKSEVRVLREGGPLAIARVAKLSDGDPAAARAELQKAYEAVTKARSDTKAGEKKPLLDVAKDLYNSARSAAETGQNAKAVELAKAAVSLTQVSFDPEKIKAEVQARIGVAHEALAKAHDAQKKTEEIQKKTEVHVRGIQKKAREHAAEIEKSAREAIKKRIEVRAGGAVGKAEGDEHRIEVRVNKTNKDGDEKVEVKVFKDGKEVPKDQFDMKDGKIEIRIVPPGEAGKAGSGASSRSGGGEVKSQVIVVPAPPTAPAPPESPRVAVLAADEVVGIGIQIADEEGKLMVQGLVPNGPAAKDGRIHAGDQVMGVEDKEGKVVEFTGKGLGDVVELIRGPVGSKIKLVVQPNGSVECKTYELTRAKIELPKEEEKAAVPAAKPGETDLPPRID